jgi:dienelactone hydrolase
LKRALAALLGVAFVAGAQDAPAGAQDLPKGAIVDKVVCRDSAAHSYALYLPSAYTPARTWPILYALDPGARGRPPLERFKDAAEALGFIVAGSNDSRNGPLEVSDRAISAMLADTAQRFAIDPRRVYVAGFSGGARTAVMAGAAMPGQVAGVIGFGAGFPVGLQPSASLRFAYFSAAGTDDFNYPELLDLDRALGSLKIPHAFLVFDGGHDWPPPAVCARALDWMEVQAMRSGARPRDEALLGRVFSAAMADAAAEEQGGRLHLAAARYASIARDLAGLCDVSPAEGKARALAQAPAAREADAALRESVRVQAYLTDQVHRLIVEALAGDDALAATRDLLAEVARTRRQGESAKRPADRMAARRVLTSTWIWLNDGVDADFESGAFRRAATRLRVMTEVRPENARVEVRLARAYARAGDRKDAIAALQRAVAKGFTDAAALEQDADLEPIRREAAFTELLARLRR